MELSARWTDRSNSRRGHAPTATGDGFTYRQGDCKESLKADTWCVGRECDDISKAPSGKRKGKERSPLGSRSIHNLHYAIGSY